MAGRGRRTGRSTSRLAGTSRTTTFPPTSWRSWTAWTARRSSAGLQVCLKEIMKTTAALSVMLSLGVFVAPALAHHSFAMYDQTKIVTLTGVMTRFVAQANHAEIHFVPLGPDGK